MSANPEILAGVWRFTGTHPDWSVDEGGEDGWDPEVSWYAVRGPHGIVLIDPLVEDWPRLDALVDDAGGCAGILRTCHWHQRSIAAAAERYGAKVWARLHGDGKSELAPDHAIGDGAEPFPGLRVLDVERADEIALWVAGSGTLIFGDAMVRRADGSLRVCPDSWTQPIGGAARLREVLRRMLGLPVEHVLVSHGPCVTGGGPVDLRAALEDQRRRG